MLWPQSHHLADGKAAVQNGEQRHQQVEVSGGPGAVAFDPTRGPGQRQQHAAEAVERHQPDQLD